MKAGDIVYDSKLFSKLTRGEAMELVCDITNQVLGTDETSRLSNGLEIDTVLRCIDEIANTEEQQNVIKEYLEEEIEREKDDDEHLSS